MPSALLDPAFVNIKDHIWLSASGSSRNPCCQIGISSTAMSNSRRLPRAGSGSGVSSRFLAGVCGSVEVLQLPEKPLA